MASLTKGVEGMNKSRNTKHIGAALLLTGIITLGALGLNGSSLPTWSPMGMFSDDVTDHKTGTMVTIKDDQGNIVSKAARGVVRGDEIITADGIHYRVEKVEESEARAKMLGKDKQFLAYRDFFDKLEVPVATVARGQNNVIGIYHTHSDESYVPTDGTEAIPFKGGIYKVGQSLMQRLNNENVRVDYDRTPHDPHDNNAYYRSRRTASRLMQSNPVAIIDVHRDGIPDPSYYRKQVSDTNVAQLRLVVGRQNPKMSSNLDFAKRMMAYANKTHPGIVKEIFMAKGNYNQDLMPTALLIEAGTHTNSRQEAENGVKLFADAIPTVLGITSTPGGTPGGGINLEQPGQTGGTWKALAWILGLTLLGGGAFLLFSTGGLDKAKSRLSSFMGREFTGFLGPRRAAGKLDAKSNAEADQGEYKPDANEIDRDNFKKIR